jgi:class 3 adenylate cyclase
MQYTVVGATVNLASRLQELAKKLDVEVVVSEAVAKACGDKLAARALGAFESRGLNSPAAKSA